MAYTQDKNGNYKRTVRCGYCYEIGHNRSSCPAKKQMHKDNIVNYEKILKKKDLTVIDRQHNERLLANHKKQLDKANNRGKNRKCSYCSEPGHTRRTCAHRKADMKVFVKECLEVRKQFADRMISTGFGVGCLGYRGDYYGENEELTIVESISWDKISHFTKHDGPQAWTDVVFSRSLKPAKYYPNGQLWSSLLPMEVSKLDNEPSRINEKMAFRIVSPVDTFIPDDFLTEEGALRAAEACDEFKYERPFNYRK
mgnify:CR=1 FL=1